MLLLSVEVSFLLVWSMFIYIYLEAKLMQMGVNKKELPAELEREDIFRTGKNQEKVS